jgi:hypothetical protein
MTTDLFAQARQLSHVKCKCGATCVAVPDPDMLAEVVLAAGWPDAEAIITFGFALSWPMLYGSVYDSACLDGRKISSQCKEHYTAQPD